MKPNTAPQKQGRIFYGWWVLLACIVGLLVGPGQFVFGSLGLFIIPMQVEFGWSRSEISLATTCFTVALIFSMPIVGNMVDRYGSKRILIPSLFIIGFFLAVLPIVLSRLWHLLLIFMLIGSLGAAANSLPFMLTLSAWFDRRRGIAIGIAMAGSGLGYAAVPPLIQYINGKYGWHAGYYTLAAIIVFIAIPIIYLLFKDSPGEVGALADGEKTSDRNTATSTLQDTGVTRHDALHSRNFWMLFFIFSLLAFSLYGAFLHIFPMLTDRGMTQAKAAIAASTVGITIMISRVIIGYLIDRIFAPHVAMVFFIMSALGIGMLANGIASIWVYLATILIGFSIGAEIDLLAFMAGRYFGLKHFGEIYGFLFGSMMLGVSLGPYIYGLCFDITGNYSLILSLSCMLVIIASIITGFLPKYPEFHRRETL